MSNDLDHFFGNRLSREDDHFCCVAAGMHQGHDTDCVNRPTGWPQAEERLRPLLAAWDDEMGEPRWSPFERRRILAGARDFAEMSTDPKVLRAAMCAMRNQGLTMSDPRSCISTARKVMNGRAQFDALLADDPVTASDGFVVCPRCGRMVNPMTLTWLCEGAHYSRGH